MNARRRSGLRLVLLAAVGTAVAVYLTLTKLAGVAPICGPSGGCETVETSAYSSVAGIPLAVFGIAFSIVIGAADLRWWLTADRRALVLVYVLGLAGTLVEAYLVYLELFVIHAICVWCAAYGVTVVVGAIGASLSLWRTRVDP